MAALTERAQERNSEPPNSSSRVGKLFGFGAACALVLAGLAVVRAQGQSPALVWLSCAGSAALVLGPALLGARALRSRKWALAMVLGGPLAALGPLMLLGQIIKSATRHRPLGALTYALIAGVVLILVWLVVARCVGFVERGRAPWLRTASGLLLVALVFGSLALSAVSMRHLGELLQPVLLDGVLILIACLSACFIDIESKLGRLPTNAGWVLWAIVVLGGLVAAALLGERLVAVSLPMSLLSLVIAS